MEQIVMKTEVQPNGEILLFNFYVDNGNQDGGESAEIGENAGHYLQNDIEEEKYIIEEVDASGDANETDFSVPDDDIENWASEDTMKLLVFYTDNKEAFLNGLTKRKNLWDVACRTMLHGKNHVSCELRLKSLIEKYAEVFVEKRKGVEIMWPFFSVCHEAFHDNNDAQLLIEHLVNQTKQVTVPVVPPSSDKGIIVTKKVNRPNTDEKMEQMLNLYLKHRKKFHKNESQRGLWELIVLEMGEKDVDYWHRRFSNYKQHYIRLLHKQKETGPGSIYWPYMKIFDQIFSKDEEFLQKFSPQFPSLQDTVDKAVPEEDVSWSDMQKTFLVKYCFDCLHEFQDDSIPDMFLWTEVGRLLDKKPDECKDKYTELKNDHIDRLMVGAYDIANRVPMQIILDTIISKETQIELENDNRTDRISWKAEEIDILVQYLYDNSEMLKDFICYYVCWCILAKKCNRSALSCRNEWESLTSLYKSLLNDKKENPDMVIEWRYIDMFDRLFDYGMSAELLDGMAKFRAQNQLQTGRIGVKKIMIKDVDDNHSIENGTDDEEFQEELDLENNTKKSGDIKAFKILQFYLKHKHKFSSSQVKRVALWNTLSKQIGISATECAHRFRNFKQVYIGYVKREISKPEKPILWPYYALCKKIFGYRSIKANLKTEIRAESDDEDWSAKNIRALINFFARNYHELHENEGDTSRWEPIARELSRSSIACSNKFLQLRKSYRKLKTMKTRNPLVKVTWNYFNLMDEIYSSEGSKNVEDIEVLEDDIEMHTYDIKEESQDEDYTIIVVPEGDQNQMYTLSNTEYNLQDGTIIQEYADATEMYQQDLTNVKEEVLNKSAPKWTKKSKKLLLILYFNYLKSHKGKEIQAKDMWMEISSKFGDRKPITCKKMFVKLKSRHIQAVSEDADSKKTPYFRLFEKILSLKPKFARNKTKAESRTYKDYVLDDSKVELALKYYLQNIDEFISPKFEKKYLWTELANYISEPVTKIFNKVNYLIQFYKSNTLEAENTQFGETLKEIFIKENLLNDAPSDNKTVEDMECSWSDDETEILLTWYLAHLEKFKNPKFVRSYLWMEASDILKKSPWACSNKMSDIRTQYRTMVKENPEGLNSWRFATLCQRIYGTGKKSSS